MRKQLNTLGRAMPRKLRWLAGAMLLSLALSVLAWSLGWVDAQWLERAIDSRGPAAMASYVALVIVLEMAWFPRLWGLLAGGLLFGPWLGAALSMLADLTTASLCFALARGAGRDWAEAMLSGRPKAQRLVRQLARRRGAVTVCLLRVLPIHWTGASYAAGLAGVPLRQYAFGTSVGVLPGAIVYNFVGAAARDPQSPVFVAGVAVLVLLAIVGAALAGRLWRAEPDAP